MTYDDKISVPEAEKVNHINSLQANITFILKVNGVSLYNSQYPV